MKKSRIASENQFSFVGPVFDNVVGLIGVVNIGQIVRFQWLNCKNPGCYPIGLGFVSWLKFKLSLLVSIIRKILHKFCIIFDCL